MYGPANNFVSMSGNALAPAGGDQPHNNMQPYLTLNMCIALAGCLPAAHLTFLEHSAEG
jgi:microcystin-dependent protein